MYNILIVLLVTLLLPSVSYAVPTLEWGNMIGDSVDAPAVFRSIDGKALDFTVIVKITADAVNEVDTAAVTLTIDTLNNFKFPLGEIPTKTVTNIPRRASKYIFWHVTPPGSVQQVYLDALSALGNVTIKGASFSFTQIFRYVVVMQAFTTTQYDIQNQISGYPLIGGFIEVRQSISILGKNPEHFAWGLFLNRYDLLELVNIKHDIPKAPVEPVTYFADSLNLPNGDYGITYRFFVKDNGDTITVHNAFHGLSGLWQEMDSELAGTGFPKLTIQKQGFTGRVSTCTPGKRIAPIPISLYTCTGLLIDSLPHSFYEGDFNFGVKAAGLYKMYLNDPARATHNPLYTSAVDDNDGSCYDLSLDQIIVVDQCLIPLKQTAVINFNRDSYEHGDTLLLTVEDSDRNKQKRTAELYTLTLTAEQGDTETVQLAETDTSSGVFTGTLTIAYATGYSPANNLLEADLGDMLIATFVDSQNNSGTKESVTDTAVMVDDSLAVGSSLYRISILPSTATIIAGQQVALEVRGYAVNGYRVHNDSLGTLTWSGGTTIGRYLSTSDTHAVFLGTMPGADQLQVKSSHQVTAASGPITVMQGDPVILQIKPDTAHIPENSSLIFTVQATDLLGNKVPDVLVENALVWSGGSSIGSFTDSLGIKAVLYGIITGMDSVTVRDTLRGLTAVSGIIRVDSTLAPDTASIRIQYTGADTISTDDTITLKAFAYDKDDNLLSPANVTWKMFGDMTGTLTPTQDSVTSFTPDKVGSVSLYADLAGIYFDTVKVVVVPGKVAFIKIFNNQSQEVQNLSLTTDDDTTMFYALGFDAKTQQIGRLPVTWKLISNDSIGTILPLAADSTMLTLVTPGTGYVVADYANGFTDTTGTITVTIGNAAKLFITPATDTSTADEFVSFTATGTDGDGNPVTDLGRLQWSVSGGITGSFNPNNVASATTFFLPVTAGTGSITVKSLDYAAAGTTGTIMVTPSGLDSLNISGMPSKIAAGTSFPTITVTALDQYGNVITGFTGTVRLSSNDPSSDPDHTFPVSYTFQTADNGTKLLNGSLFTLVTAGNRTISVTSGAVQTAFTIQVNPAALNYIRVEPGLTGQRTGETAGGSVPTATTLDMHASAYDTYVNYRGDISADWSFSTGNLNPVTAPPSNAVSYTFKPDPSSQGTSGKIQASGGGFMDTTELITVVASPDKIRIVTTNDGDKTKELNSISLTTDDSLSLYAAAYDANDNFVGNVPVDWTSTVVSGTFSYSKTGVSSYMLDPKKSGSGTITITFGSLSDASGTVTITSGALAQINITNSNNGSSPQPSVSMTTDSTLSLWAAGYDQDNNFIGNQSVSWSTSGSLSVSDFSADSGSSTSYAPGRPGSGTIKAVNANNSLSDSFFVIVKTGALTRVVIEDGNKLEVGDVNLQIANDTIDLFLSSYDTDTNFLGFVNGTWSSLQTAPNFSFSGNGQSVTFVANTLGTGHIIAQYVTTATFTDTTGIITITDTIQNHDPSTPSLSFPNNGAQLNESSTLLWTTSTDPDSGDSVTYRLELSLDSNFINPEIVDSGLTTFVIILKNLTHAFKLEKLKVYFWRVRAEDNYGGQSLFSSARYLTYVGNPIAMIEQFAALTKPVFFFQNPGSKIRLHFVVAHAQEIKVSVTNIFGEKITATTSQLYHKGKHNLVVDKILPPGIYFLKVEGENFSTIEKVLVIR